MQNYRDLKVWQRSHQVTLAVYRISQRFPQSELYGLTSQMRRAASSVPANIAEGCGRSTDADFLRFLQIALGSAHELDYHLLLAHDLNLIPTHDYQTLLQDLTTTRRMLNALIQKIKTP
jgi:four helix bundle protein